VNKIAALLLLCLSPLAIAAPVTLRPMEGERHVLAEPATNFTGSCGGAVVRVMGVTSTYGNQFGIDLDAGVIIVRQAGKEWRCATNCQTITPLRVFRPVKAIDC
jgi:hypothetical protein